MYQCGNSEYVGVPRVTRLWDIGNNEYVGMAGVPTREIPISLAVRPNGAIAMRTPGWNERCKILNLLLDDRGAEKVEQADPNQFFGETQSWWVPVNTWLDLGQAQVSIIPARKGHHIITLTQMLLSWPDHSLAAVRPTTWMIGRYIREKNGQGCWLDQLNTAVTLTHSYAPFYGNSPESCYQVFRQMYNYVLD